MKQVIEEFTQANFLKKLAIIADIATILGVSVATFVAGPFLSEVTGLGFDASEFMVAIFFYFIFLVLLLGILNIVWTSFIHLLNKDPSSFVGFLFLSLLLLALYASFVPSIKTFLGDVTNNRYMMPKPAQLVVSSVEVNGTDSIGEFFTINGKVNFALQINKEDYSVALYGLNTRSGLYELFSFHNSEMFEINDDGNFKIPQIHKDFNFGESYIVVFRKLDSRRIEQYDFPNSLTVIPNIDLGNAGAYVHKLKGGNNTN